MAGSRSYHHGDLRRALLDAAAQAMAGSDPAALSLRDLARRAGVSHAAPAHHFGDKAGLLTALATQGFDLLGEALRGGGDDLLATGVAYVGFAVRHKAHFEVMFRPELYRADDPELVAARDRTGELLRAGVARHTGGDPDVDALAAWSIVHGFATLWLSGALPTRVGADPEAAAREVIGRLFR
ncbi:TetR/AcrR family transcriptional regulator [Micromonospora siamensis]|uniref:DNA-binding transcriptional regulator, AcrR family n=1 Tax=Micromonospora siamensis TaxID=299152 RepID=A0A1C5HCE0_9ACTN|nr:TetR/AcrR family transcriptional regulator [Micromonospora siamensis]SCG43698.1 DNA-binding transcriptional regulator, AcrR family [Micromonospora siamensis]